MGAMKQRHIELTNKIIDRLSAMVHDMRALGLCATWYEDGPDSFVFVVAPDEDTLAGYDPDAVRIESESLRDWNARRLEMLRASGIDPDKDNSREPKLDPEDIPF